MSQIVQAQCGYCGKRFGLRTEQLNRQVRCPHCKTVVQISTRGGGAGEAAHGAHETPSHEDSAASRRPAAYATVGLRHKSVAIVWVVLLGLALIGVIIGVWALYGRGGGSLVPRIGVSSRTGLPFERDKVIEPSTPPVAIEGKGTAPGKAPPPAPPDPIAVKVERLLRGHKEETVTYAVGRVTNNTADTIQVLKVVVNLMDKDEAPMGDAVAVLLTIPPNYTVPLVAEWKHERGARATRWMLASYETNPTGIPRELPPLTTDDPWPVRDPNSVTPTGKVSAKVTNRGAVPVRDLLVAAILVDTQHKIVGAARETITKEIKPEQSQEVSIPWDHCAGTLVNSVEVWVQPAL